MYKYECFSFNDTQRVVKSKGGSYSRDLKTLLESLLKGTIEHKCNFAYVYNYKASPDPCYIVTSKGYFALIPKKESGEIYELLVRLLKDNNIRWKNNYWLEIVDFEGSPSVIKSLTEKYIVLENSISVLDNILAKLMIYTNKPISSIKIDTNKLDSPKKGLQIRFKPAANEYGCIDVMI